MKRAFFIMASMSFLLASCSQPQPEIKTYNVIIQANSRFHTNQRFFTFEKDNFSPITFNYEIDEGCTVYEVSTDSEKSACTFDPTNKSVTVTPKENKDINLTVSVTVLSNVSTIYVNTGEGGGTIDEHFHPDQTVFLFRHDDFKPIKSFYTVDNLYVMHSMSVIVSTDADVTYDTAESTFTITPKANTDIYINVKTTPNFKTITFYPGVGELGDGTKAKLDLPLDKTWGECVGDSQYATYKSYNFSGWVDALGVPIDSDTPISEFIVNTVYASFTHRIRLVSESTEFTSIEYHRNESYPYEISWIDFHLAVTNPKYTVPSYDSYEVSYLGEPLTNVGSPPDYSVTSGSFSNESIMHVYNKDVINGIGALDVKVIDKHNEFHAYFSNSDNHLSSDITPQTTAFAYEDFSFNITVINQENSDIKYCIPDQLDIKIGDSTDSISSDGYKIEIKDDTRQEAVVTVFADYVYDTINVAATAQQIECYYYEFIGYGAITSSETIGYQESAVMLETTLSGEDISSIGPESIAIKVNNHDWYSYVDLPEDYTEIVHYDDNAKTITIDPNTKFRSIKFHIFSPNYSAFENGSWNQIDEICTSNYADNFFNVGEEKELQVGNKSNAISNYKLRIIGIKHDTLADGSKNASLSIEFEQVINNMDGTVHSGKLASGKDDRSFPNNNYDKYLNSEFINMLPGDLTAVIKDVGKQYYKAHTGIRTYTTRIFPLSRAELNIPTDDAWYLRDEGSVYKYYENAGNDERMKKTCSGNNSEYWTRSIENKNDSHGTYIQNDGDKGSEFNDENKPYIAAFCI